MSTSLKRFSAPLLTAGVLLVAAASSLAPRAASAWTSDNRDGTFTNPVLYGDYPDPDIIRVGSDLYMATTTFVSVPGIEILHSKDLVNWEIAGYAARTLEIDPKYSLIGGSRYSRGVWAPCLRYHRGTFYVIDNIQGAGTVVYRATDPAGPWTMNRLDGYLYDPGLLFDDDGTPLVYHGTHGNISVAVLDADLTKVLSVAPAYKLLDGEGSHAYRVGGMYYVFNSLYGAHPTLICSRSKNRTGPFVTVTVCNNGTPWAAPHQGGMVQLANGDWWGFSLCEAGSAGRDVWVGPITWSDGWPYFGNPASPSILKTNRKPAVGRTFPVMHPPTDDTFSGPRLGRQWQWNHNPDDTKWSLTARPGYLRLYAQPAPDLPNARNTLTLRTEGPRCTGEIKIDTRSMRPGDRAGLSLLEQYYGYLAVYREADGRQRIVRAVNKNGSLVAPSEDVTDTVSDVNATNLWLQVSCDTEANTAQFRYSTDGHVFTPVGASFPMHFTLATFQGDRFGIFNYSPNSPNSPNNPSGAGGWIDVDYFRQGEPSKQTP